MDKYFRIANNQYIYDNRFDSLEGAKSEIEKMKNNEEMEDIYIDQFNIDVCDWRIEEFEETKYGGCILSRTPFRYLADGVNPDRVEFDETETYNKNDYE